MFERKRKKDKKEKTKMRKDLFYFQNYEKINDLEIK